MFLDAEFYVSIVLYRKAEKKYFPGKKTHLS